MLWRTRDGGGSGVRRWHGWQLSAVAEKATVGMWFFSHDLEEVREPCRFLKREADGGR